MKITGIVILAILLFATCKKDSDSRDNLEESLPTTTVEYQIIPMNVYFTQIRYRDNSGNQVTITDPSEFEEGKRTISISDKPFVAKIETTVFNSTLSTIEYSLAILVDGQLKKIITTNVPAGTTITNFVEYTVQ